MIEQLIERDIEGAGHLFERFDSRDSMAIFHAGDITTKQASTLLDVALAEILLSPNNAQPFTNNHGGTTTSGHVPSKYLLRC